jgi:two-component sensor histidine kinase
MRLATDSTPFRREVEERFGLVPNFFCSAPDAPELVEKLWDFAKSAYLDNPMPSLFKERLFVFLSRFCEVRYCVTRHCAFLLGYGHVAGDATASTQSLEDAIKLLTKLTPWQRANDDWLQALESPAAHLNWPASDTEYEDQLFAAAAVVFVEARRSDRARHALRNALGGSRYEYLLGFLAFVRTAHYWTAVHPNLAPEDDVQGLLEANAELARLLLHDAEASRCDMGTQLYAELEDLRNLQERHKLELANQALAHEVAQKEFLLQEINRRLNDSLQAVSSLLSLQIGNLEDPSAAESVRSKRLYAGSDHQVIDLDVFLADLCGMMGQALGCPDGLKADLVPVKISATMATPLALIVNELIANAVKYGGPFCSVSTTTRSDGFLTLTVSDAGGGPPVDPEQRARESRIVETFAKSLRAVVEQIADARGYAVKISVPLNR